MSQIGRRLGYGLVELHIVQYEGSLSIEHSAQIIAHGIQLFIIVDQVLPDAHRAHMGGLFVLFATAEQERQLSLVFRHFKH